MDKHPLRSSIGFVRELVPGAWRLTGEVTSSPLSRLHFASHVVTQAIVAQFEDLDAGINPLSAQEILADDARRDIGKMALQSEMSLPPGFMPNNT